MAIRIVLAAKLDSAAVADLRSTLLKSRNDDIELDGSAVDHLGALCLELILSARHLWQKFDKSVSLVALSERMTEDLGRLGLTPDYFERGVA